MRNGLLLRMRCLVGVLGMGSAMAFGGTLVVVEKGAASLAIVDAGTGKMVGSVPEGGVTGHEVAVAPDGKTAFVPVYGNSGVGKPGTDGRMMVAIDLASKQVVGSVDFGHGVRPHCAVFNPKDGLLYVTTELDNAVAILDVRDPRRMKIVGTVPTGQRESHMLTISHDGLRGYTANVGPGTVSVLDLVGRKVLRVIKVSGDTQRISVSNDDRWVFTSDQTKARMAVIDTRTNTVSRWIALDGLGYGSASTVDGRWLLVALWTQKKVAVIDLGKMEVFRTLDVPAEPQAVLVRPDGKVAYVSCDSSNEVAEIDLEGEASAWKVGRLIEVGKSADGMGWGKD
jgi:DNA-binding beta-propeller fold protein YncE